MGFTQTSLAQRLGVSREAVSQWLKSDKFPRPAALLGLGKALALSYGDLVLLAVEESAEPVFAYRTNRNKEAKQKDLLAARDMAEGLRMVTPFLPAAPIVNPMTFTKSSLDRPFVASAATEIRRLLAATDHSAINLATLVGQLVQQSIILIPVLWGPNGHNGLHVRLPQEQRTFIYLNLDKSWMDFRFWLIHEWAHVLAPDLGDALGEAFADALASEVLYPDATAEQFLRLNHGQTSPGTWITSIVAEADHFEISPITVNKRLHQFSQERSLSIPEPDIFGAVTNHLKKIPTVAVAIWKSGQPEVADYINLSRQVFQTPVFDAVARLVQEKGLGPSFIERVLKVPFGDAGGIHGYLSGH